MYCLCVVYVCVLLWDMCSTVMCLSVMVMCLADDVLFVVIVAVKVFMVQLLSPRQISLNGTIKYIVSYSAVYLVKILVLLSCTDSLRLSSIIGTEQLLC